MSRSALMRTRAVKCPDEAGVISERKGDEVCVYTDSNKVMVRRLGEIYDKGARREYWEGER